MAAFGHTLVFSAPQVDQANSTESSSNHTRGHGSFKLKIDKVKSRVICSVREYGSKTAKQASFGVVLGAGVGTLIPGVGSVVGGIIGGIAGLLYDVKDGMKDLAQKCQY